MPDAPLQRLVDQVRAAQADGSALCIRGSGSKDFYGGPLHGTRLDVTELRGIGSYEPTEMVITARAGTPLSELEDALSAYGQGLVFEPPRFGGGTVGGMVAAGLAGPARASVGAVRDFVLGMSIINGRGEILQFGGQVMKNVAGYDLSRLFAGSMGILGVICEVSLKVPPIPVDQASWELPCSLEEALRRSNQWVAAALPVNASAWEAGLLRVRLAGARAAVTSGGARLAREFGAQSMEGSEARQYWDDLREQRAPFFAAAMSSARTLWRISVPALTPDLDLPGASLVEWHGAQRWLLSDAPPALVRERSVRAGGHASAFHSPGARDQFQSPLSAPLERIHRSLKQSFDPSGIFNRGRLYPWL